MTQPRVGVTHDVVIHVNNSVSVGLIVSPGSYRIVNPPSMVPRIAQGDPRGLDFHKWRAFVQNDFSGGAGQYRYDKEVGNNRFAESHLIEIGLSPVLSGPGQRPRDVPFDQLGDQLTLSGAITMAPLPVATSAITPLATLFTTGYRTFALEMSNRPHILHHRSGFVYTNTPHTSDVWATAVTPPLTQRDVTRSRLWSGARQSPFNGVWAVTNTQLPGRIFSAVAFSNHIFVSHGSLGLSSYGSTNGTSPASWYVPSYNTVAHRIDVFDGKLWRVQDHQIASLDATVGVWSALLEAGDPSSTIRNTAAVSGRFYLGKDDGLYTYEAGRIYLVQSFDDEADSNNFALMVQHRNELYFNVRRTIYRISNYGTIERIPIPFLDGYVEGGASVGDELYFLVRDAQGNAKVWVHNAETGGTSEWFNSLYLERTPTVTKQLLGPNSIHSTNGVLWLAPSSLTIGSIDAAPIVGVNLLTPFARQLEDFRPQLGNLSYLITSTFNFGYPSLNKLFNKVVIDYNLYSNEDSIDIYYLPTVEGGLLTAAFDNTTDALANLVDGSLETSHTWNTTDGFHMYFGFSKPVTEVHFVARTDQVTIDDVTTDIEYWNGTAWVNAVNKRFAPRQGHINTSGALVIHTITRGRRGGTSWAFDAPGWQKTVYEGVEAYYIRVIVFPNLLGGNIFFYQVQAFQQISEKLNQQNWQLLGTVANRALRTASLAFPLNTQSKDITLKCVLHGGAISKPEVKSIEIEWMPIGPDAGLLDFHMVVTAINNLRRLDGAVENSAAFVLATAFSLNASRLRYVAQLPAPAPVGHTRYVQVQLAPTGVMPMFEFQTTLGGQAQLEAEVPLILSEL